MTTLDVIKLAKVMELTRSNMDGERLAALNRAASMLQAAGLTWTQLLTTPAARFAQRHDAPRSQPWPAYRPQPRAPEPAPEPPDESDDDDFVYPNTAAHEALTRTATGIRDSSVFENLKPHEQTFVVQISGWKGRISKSQVSWLERIISKIQADAFMTTPEASS